MAFRRDRGSWAERRAARAENTRWAKVVGHAEPGESYVDSVLIDEIVSGQERYEHGFLVLSQKAVYIYTRMPRSTQELILRAPLESVTQLLIGPRRFAMEYRGQRVDKVGFGAILSAVGGPMNERFGDRVAQGVPADTPITRDQ